MIMKSGGASTLFLAAVLFITGVLLVSPIVEWLIKAMGYALMALGVVVAIVALLGGRSRTKGF